ncbi:MAG: DUF853 family protein [Clostridia bacterium]|nr:DUF853 family protein [Clostridia bacterium]
MLLNGTIWLGTSDQGAVSLLPSMANRHGLIAGATGTGKTVTLQVLAEGFSQLGVPVFMADVKGDLAGICCPGQGSAKIDSRLEACGVSHFPFRACPVTFWDVYGEKGHPVRTTVSEMGPLLLARMLGLNETQTGVLHIIFRIADDEGMLLLDLKDVKAMLAYVGENAARYTLDYGNVAKATVGAIQRAIAILEDQGGDQFFGEPALDLSDWLCQDDSGNGMVNILAAEKLFRKPAMYSTFLLWMLGELYELLPEQGDRDMPRMVFFFDEAHLLFDDCSKTLLERIEQVVRLIRSKGVGVYFITQSPTDVPSNVLGQLSGRVQHALRAFTPQEQKVVRAVAQTFRVNPAFDTEAALTQLATGEALLSFLQEDGTPSVVQKATILPPQSQIGMISDELRATFMETDMIGTKYDEYFDRESAYEVLSAQFVQTGATQTQVVRPVPAQEEQYAARPAENAQPAQPVYAPMTFRVFNPVTGQYEEQVMPNMMQQVPQPAAQQAPQYQQPAYQQPAYQQPVQQTTAYPVPVPTAQEAVPAAEEPKQKERKVAKKPSEMTTAEKYLNSFLSSATTGAGREVGRSISRSLLGILGIGSKKK